VMTRLVGRFVLSLIVGMRVKNDWLLLSDWTSVALWSESMVIVYSPAESVAVPQWTS
jgi:hypothetical protein